jgi:hypothetical protein
MKAARGRRSATLRAASSRQNRQDVCSLPASPAHHNPRWENPDPVVSSSYHSRKTYPCPTNPHLISVNSSNVVHPSPQPAKTAKFVQNNLIRQQLKSNCISTLLYALHTTNAPNVGCQAPLACSWPSCMGREILVRCRMQPGMYGAGENARDWGRSLLQNQVHRIRIPHSHSHHECYYYCVTCVCVGVCVFHCAQSGVCVKRNQFNRQIVRRIQCC